LVVLVALWSACGVAAGAVVSVLVVELVLEVEVWLLVSLEVAGVVLAAGALDEAAPVWALSFAAVPVVELAGVELDVAEVELVAGVVSGAAVVEAGAVPVWLALLDGAAVVDEVWSVTGGWPAAFDGFAGAAGAVLCAFGSAGVVVDWLLVLVLVVLD
jgi:hypothetical protein